MNFPCRQCSTALPGGAEEAAAESDEEDQHLHRHLHALLCSLCDHKVGAGGEIRGKTTPGSHCGVTQTTHPPARTSLPSHFLSAFSPHSQICMMRLADLVISNTPQLCWCCCCISTFFFFSSSPGASLFVRNHLHQSLL